MNRHFAEHAWLTDGWQPDVALAIGDDGTLAAVESAADAPRLGRWVLPGIPNAHSHAFQRAMAGLAERQTDPDDSFWTWREVMYAFAGRVTPEALRDVAAMLYVEMLEAGYTSVCEFHYLHHQPDGTPYADPAAMSIALVEAARETGIGLTLLPALYMTGGLDGRPLEARQRRFGHDVDGYLRLVERLHGFDDVRVGVCFHSLRAVPAGPMRTVLESLPATLPVHLHVAEQEAEVQACLAARGTRPVEWLLDHMPVDFLWTLVHATHLTETEVRAIAARGATVALCPTTEANLGDGLFPLRDFLVAGGLWSVGSDSHVSTSPVEELRWLEYGQRLRAHRRNVAALPHLASVGESLLGHALAGGARATMQPVGALEPGQRADLLVLDEDAPELAARSAENVVDSWIFSGSRNLVREVFAGGRRVVADGRHVKRDAIAARYRRTAAALTP